MVRLLATTSGVVDPVTGLHGSDVPMFSLHHEMPPKTISPGHGPSAATAGAVRPSGLAALPSMQPPSDQAQTVSAAIALVRDHDTAAVVFFIRAMGSP